MFSILNEIFDNSHFRTTSVVGASIGLACSLYILVGITGYLSYGDKVSGNIVSMCKLFPRLLHPLLFSHTSRCPLRCLNYRPPGNCRPGHVLLPPASSPLPRVSRCRHQLAATADLWVSLKHYRDISLAGAQRSAARPTKAQ